MQSKPQSQSQPQAAQNQAVVELRQLQKQVSELAEELAATKKFLNSGGLSDTIAVGFLKAWLALLLVWLVLAVFTGLIA